jgi:hypothetical protein
MTTSDSPSQPKRRIAPAWVALSLTLVLALAAGGLGIVRASPGLQETPPPDEPLTDIAGPQPESDVSADEAPDVRLAQLGSSDLPDPGFEVIYPEDTADPNTPEEWSQGLAFPEEAPIPPDPFAEPETVIDPSRNPGQEEYTIYDDLSEAQLVTDTWVSLELEIISPTVEISVTLETTATLANQIFLPFIQR